MREKWKFIAFSFLSIIHSNDDGNIIYLRSCKIYAVYFFYLICFPNEWGARDLWNKLEEFIFVVNTKGKIKFLWWFENMSIVLYDAIIIIFCLINESLFNEYNFWIQMRKKWAKRKKNSFLYIFHILKMTHILHINLSLFCSHRDNVQHAYEMKLRGRGWVRRNKRDCFYMLI